MTTAPADERHVAIIGMSGRFPGAPDLDAFWHAIAEGRDTISRFDAESEKQGDLEHDAALEGSTYVRARGLLPDIEMFDAAFFGFTPSEAIQLDPQHRVWLEVAWEALEAAGYAHDRHEQIVSVYAGSFPNTYLYHNLLPDRAALEEYVRMRRTHSFALLASNDPAFLPSRTAYKLNLRGPAVNVQTACSTSLVAVAMAVQGLVNYESDIALAGGVCISVPQRTGYFYQQGAITSRDGVCRPYDANACGTVFGNGAGAVVLKRLSDARRDHDPILAVIRGAAINNDGHTKVSYFAPSVQGQAEAIAAALSLADVEARTIGYVEGHGTATPMGDPIEVEALKLAFGAEVPRATCCLGSVKGNIGHLDAAAGIAGLMRAVLALQHRQLPATAHFEHPNPELHIEESPFFVTGQTRPWPAGAQPRRAGVSAFGIGGTNVHVVLEEAPADPHATRADAGPTTLLLSAASREALDDYGKRLAGWFDARSAATSSSAPSPSLTSVAHVLHDRRKLFPHRRALRVESWEDARTALRDPARWDDGLAIDGTPKLVMSFPGQGSLRAGALAPLFAETPDLRQHFEPLALAASDLAHFDLLAWAIQPTSDPEPLRRDNAKAQLAIFCVGTALARWLESRGVRAEAFLGHSLGEWIAAHLAGVLSSEDALWAVHRRGALMQETGPGAALIVRLSELEVAKYLGEDVALACVNGPKLCLLSGRPDAIDACAARLTADGVTSRRAPIDVAVHSPIMEPIVGQLRCALATRRWSTPDRPLLSPVTGGWLPADLAADPGFWAAQPRKPVRFDDALITLTTEPRCLVLEVGVGHALTTLAQARLGDPRQRAALSLWGPSDEEGHPQPHRLQRALHDLWAHGLDSTPIAARPIVETAPILPTYPFQRQRYWKDPPPRALPGNLLSAVRATEEVQRAPSAPLAIAGAPRCTELIELIHEMSGIDRATLDPKLPFSSLGLDSLFLVQLAERLSEKTGHTVSFAQVSQSNSIDKLAATLPPESEHSRPEPLSLARPPGLFRGLFSIRKGDGQLPLLLIHGDLGNDFLPPYLSREQTIYGYAHQGSEGELIRLRTVESLAARCYEEWLAATHGAPCIIAGHSFGGLIAHRVAHLLRQNGLWVELLIMIDTAHPRSFLNPHHFGPRRLLRHLRDNMAKARFRRDIARAEQALNAHGKVPIELRPKHILGVYELAVRSYMPPPHIDVDALLFGAEQGPWKEGSWRSSEFRQFTIEMVPGDHLSIVRDSHAFEPVGACIAQRLHRLRQTQAVQQR